VISPRGTSSSNNNSSSNSSGRLASRVAGKSRAPSECNPFFPLVYLSCRRVLTHPLLVRASSLSAPKVAPPPLDTMSGGSGSQQQASAGSGAGNPPLAAATVPMATAASMTVMPSSTPSTTAEEVPTAPTPAIKGDAGGGASSSISLPTLEETEVVFGRRLRSGAESEAAPVPLTRVLSRAHQALHETEEAILRECVALEVEHQRLSDWRTQLEERTKAASRQFTSEWSELERDRKDYKRDLLMVFARELEASRRENRLAKREEALSEREALTIELWSKLKALDQTLEAQRVQQVEAIEKIKKWERELEDKASNIALTEENLKEKDASLDMRETDLAWREKDLAFREEMLEKREMLLAEHELEAEEKERKLSEWVRQFEATQATPGPQAVEAAKKALEDLQAEHHARVQRIAEWAGEASTALVPLGISPITVSGPPASISDALPVLDSTAERLRRLD
jgi:hypothetical protein